MRIITTLATLGALTSISFGQILVDFESPGPAACNDTPSNPAFLDALNIPGLSFSVAAQGGGRRYSKLSSSCTLPQPKSDDSAAIFNWNTGLCGPQDIDLTSYAAEAFIPILVDQGDGTYDIQFDAMREGVVVQTAMVNADSSAFAGTYFSIHFNVPAGFNKIRISVPGAACTGVAFPGLRFALDDIEIGVGLDFTRYCTPNAVNTTGVPGEIWATGTNTASANDLLLTALQLPNGEFGYYVASRTQGFIANPNSSQGNLCVLGNITRFNRAGELGMTSGGMYSFQVPLNDVPEPPGPASVTVMAGDTWNFQFWYRDTLPSGPTSNFTDAIEILFE